MAGPYGKLKADKLVWWNATTSADVENTLEDIANKASLTGATFTGDINGNLVGNVTGDVTGDVTGSSGSCTGNAATATTATTAGTLTTARNIGGVSFDGSANIDLPGVNAAGTQNTTGSAATVTGAAQAAITSVGTLTALNTSGDVDVVGDIAAVDLTLSGDLTVNGTQTILNTATLEVEDKNIVIAKGSTTDAAADGGGITLKGTTDKTITWTDSTDSWDFNQDIKTSGTVTDSEGDVRKIPAGQFGAVTLADTDAGKFVAASGAVGLGTEVVGGGSIFEVGDAVTIFCNHTADITLTFTGITCYLAGEDGNKTSLTLATRGIATLLCIASNTYVISGAGLS